MRREKFFREFVSVYTHVIDKNSTTFRLSEDAASTFEGRQSERNILMNVCCVCYVSLSALSLLHEHNLTKTCRTKFKWAEIYGTIPFGALRRWCDTSHPFSRLF